MTEQPSTRLEPRLGLVEAIGHPSRPCSPAPPSETAGAKPRRYPCSLQQSKLLNKMRQLHHCTRRGAALLLQFLHSMLLVCENSRCKWHRRVHTHISQGDNECRSCFFLARHVTQNATFVTTIGQVPHGVMPPICFDNIFGLQMLKHWSCQFGFEGRSSL